MIDTSAAPGALPAPANAGNYVPASLPSQAKRPRQVRIGQQQASDVNLTGVHKQRQADLFKRQLLATYNLTTTDQLYNHIATLPEHDPIRMAFATLGNKQTGQSELQQTKHYIESVINADAKTLRNLGMQHYVGHSVLKIALEAVDYTLAHI